MERPQERRMGIQTSPLLTQNSLTGCMEIGFLNWTIPLIKKKKNTSMSVWIRLHRKRTSATMRSLHVNPALREVLKTYLQARSIPDTQTHRPIYQAITRRKQ